MSCHPRLLSLFLPVTGKDAGPEVTESCGLCPAHLGVGCEVGGKSQRLDFHLTFHGFPVSSGPWALSPFCPLHF